MLRRRTTAGDNFLTSYTQNYCYILNKLGTLTSKASLRFFARRKKPTLTLKASARFFARRKKPTLTLKASARFFARRKKPWLAEAANCSLLQEVLLQPLKNV